MNLSVPGTGKQSRSPSHFNPIPKGNGHPFQKPPEMGVFVPCHHLRARTGARACRCSQRPRRAPPKDGAPPEPQARAADAAPRVRLGPPIRMKSPGTSGNERKGKYPAAFTRTQPSDFVNQPLSCHDYRGREIDGTRSDCHARISTGNGLGEGRSTPFDARIRPRVALKGVHDGGGQEGILRRPRDLPEPTAPAEVIKKY